MNHNIPAHRGSHCLLLLCLLLTVVALVLAGCKTEQDPAPEDHHPTEFVRASGHPCRC